jgi:hypothetical protein
MSRQWIKQAFVSHLPAATAAHGVGEEWIHFGTTLVLAGGEGGAVGGFEPLMAPSSGSNSSWPPTSVDSGLARMTGCTTKGGSLRYPVMGFMGGALHSGPAASISP